MKTLKALVWMLVGLALGAGSLYFGFQALRGVVADRELWEKGIPASHVRVGGRVKTNRMILKEYQLEIDFQDTSGGMHHGREEFTTLFTTVDQGRPPELRYDRTDPSRFVVSWARDVTGGRLSACVLFLVMGPVFLVGAVLYLRGERRRVPAPSRPPVPTEWR